MDHPVGKRRAVTTDSDALMPAAADMARMWTAVSAAHETLRQRRLYYLASDAEERMADQLSLIPLLQDWVPVTANDAAELTHALRAYTGIDIDPPRDRQAEALRTCIRAMTMHRARSSVPVPRDGEGDVGQALIS